MMAALVHIADNRDMPSLSLGEVEVDVETRVLLVARVLTTSFGDFEECMLLELRDNYGFTPAELAFASETLEEVCR